MADEKNTWDQPITDVAPWRSVGLGEAGGHVLTQLEDRIMHRINHHDGYPMRDLKRLKIDGVRVGGNIVLTATRRLEAAGHLRIQQIGKKEMVFWECQDRAVFIKNQERPSVTPERFKKLVEKGEAMSPVIDENEKFPTMDQWMEKRGKGVEGAMEKFPMPVRPLIIGICGKAGSGKDTLCTLLLDAIHGSFRVAFADRMKDILMNAALRPCNKKDPAHRRAMIMLGQAARMINPNAWIEHAEIERLGHRGTRGELGANMTCIMPDVRFNNEIDGIVRQGGVIAVLEGREDDIGSENKNDVSENEWGDKLRNMRDRECIFRFDNSEHDLRFAKLRGQVREFLIRYKFEE